MMRIFLGTLAVILLLVTSEAFAAVFPDKLIPADGKVPGGSPPAAEIAADPSCSGPTAVPGCDPDCSFRWGSIHFSCIIPYIGYLVQVVIFFSGGLCVFTIILGGYKWALGGVIQAQAEEGKRTLTRALVGFAIVVLSYLLVNTIIQALT